MSLVFRQHEGCVGGVADETCHLPYGQSNGPERGEDSTEMLNGAGQTQSSMRT